MAKPPVLDPTGAPMIWVDSLSAYLHWLPVTKVQFEYFLCDRLSGSFDQKWYESILNQYAPQPGRVAPYQVNESNYFKALLTGIHPREIDAYVEWLNELGRGHFRLPDEKEWARVYAELAEKPAVPLTILGDLPLRPRMQDLLNRFDAVARHYAPAGPKQTEQMLMRNGILEWATSRDPRHGSPMVARGRIPSKELGLGWFSDYTGASAATFKAGVDPNTQREKAFGFRLIGKDIE